MQSQPERLVMENLCTSSPLLPPHLINNTLIYYLHFRGISPRKFEAGREREINCRPPLSVFNYNVCNGSSICQLGTPRYLCHCDEMKPCCLEKIKQYFFCPWLSLTDAKTKYSEWGICMAFEDKENYISCFNIRCIQY